MCLPRRSATSRFVTQGVRASASAARQGRYCPRPRSCPVNHGRFETRSGGALCSPPWMRLGPGHSEEGSAYGSVARRVGQSPSAGSRGSVTRAGSRVMSFRPLGARQLTLPFPVVEVWAAPNDVVERLVVASPDPDLVAVGILDDPELVRVRKQGHADVFVAGVADAVGASRPHREADDIAPLRAPFRLPEFEASAFPRRRSATPRRPSGSDTGRLPVPAEVRKPSARAAPHPGSARAAPIGREIPAGHFRHRASHRERD
jgi:hypothetical protein